METHLGYFFKGFQLVLKVVDNKGGQGVQTAFGGERSKTRGRGWWWGGFPLRGRTSEKMWGWEESEDAVGSQTGGDVDEIF